MDFPPRAGDETDLVFVSAERSTIRPPGVAYIRKRYAHTTLLNLDDLRQLLRVLPDVIAYLESNPNTT